MLSLSSYLNIYVNKGKLLFGGHSSIHVNLNSSICRLGTMLGNEILFLKNCLFYKWKDKLIELVLIYFIS